MVHCSVLGVGLKEHVQCKVFICGYCFQYFVLYVSRKWAEQVIEGLSYYTFIFTRLVTREYFIDYVCQESLKGYVAFLFGILVCKFLEIGSLLYTMYKAPCTLKVRN